MSSAAARSRQTTSGGGDRRRGDDREREPAAPSRRLNEYFIKGDGLNREVIQSEICRFLGPEATCRQAEYEGSRGYMIKAYRPFTPEMLTDLREQSAQFESERAAAAARRPARGSGREALEYGDSQTRRAYEGSDPRHGGAPQGYGSAPGPYGQESYGMPQGYGQAPQGYTSAQPGGYGAPPYGQVSYPPGYSMSQPAPGIPASAEPRYPGSDPRDPRYGGQPAYGYAQAPSGPPGYLPPGQGYPDAHMDMGRNEGYGQQHYGAQPDRPGAGGQRDRNGMPMDHNGMPGANSSPGVDPYGQPQYQRQQPSPYEQPSGYGRGGHSSRPQDSYASGGGRRR